MSEAATPPPATPPPAELPDEALRTGALAPLAPGAIVAGRYRLDAQLGAGGFGAVWRARNLDLDRDVALKLLHPELARDPALQKRFLREVDVATRFVHRYAVQVRDAGRDPARGLLYLTMDLVSGQTLADALRAGPLEPTRAARLTAQALEALGEAHRAGLVHRDLKPANLMLCRGPGGQEEVRVLDFGIARAFERAGGEAEGGGEALHTLTAAGAVIGTVAYMSPEQAQGLPLDARSDLYSLGVTLYQALSGRFPHEPDPQAQSGARSLLFKIVSEPPRDLAAVAPAVPAPLRAVVMRALAKAPADRWPDAAGFAAALREATGPGGPDPNQDLGSAPTLIPAGGSGAAHAQSRAPTGTGAQPTGALGTAPPPGVSAGTTAPLGPAPPVAPVAPAATPETSRGGLGRAALRALVVGGASVPVAVVTVLVMLFGGMALGQGGNADEALPLGLVAALLGLLWGAVSVGLEEVARLARRSPGGAFLALLGGLWLLGVLAAGLGLAAGELGPDDLGAIALLGLLAAVPIGVSGLSRLGALPGLGGAPLGGGARLLLVLLASGLVCALGLGPLSEGLQVRPRDPADAAGSVFLLLSMAGGASLALGAGDLLARRLGLDPRPPRARGGLPGCLAVGGWALLLGLFTLLGLLTGWFDRGLDLRRPRIEVWTPLDGTTLPGHEVLLEGRVLDLSPVELAVEPVAWDWSTRTGVPLDVAGGFQVRLLLRPGWNMVRLVARDEAGNEGEARLSLSCPDQPATSPDPGAYPGKGGK